MNFKNAVAERQNTVGKNAFDLEKTLERIHTNYLQRIDLDKITFSFLTEELSDNLVLGDAVRLEQELILFIDQVCKTIVSGKISITAKEMIQSNQYFIIRFKLLVESPHFSDKTIGHKAEENISLFREIKENIENMGGSLEYYETTKGAKAFSMVLPFEDSGVQKPIAAESVAVQNELMRTLSILLVSKDENDDEVFHNLFQEWRCNYDIKRQPLQVMALLEKKKFDAVFLNVTTGEEEFLTLSEQLYAFNKLHNNNITSVAFTEVSTSSKHKINLGDHCSKLVVKPFDENRLRDLVVKSIESHIKKPDPRNKCFIRN